MQHSIGLCPSVASLPHLFSWRSSLVRPAAAAAAASNIFNHLSILLNFNLRILGASSHPVQYAVAAAQAIPLPAAANCTSSCDCRLRTFEFAAAASACCAAATC